MRKSLSNGGWDVGPRSDSRVNRLAMSRLHETHTTATERVPFCHTLRCALVILVLAVTQPASSQTSETSIPELRRQIVKLSEECRPKPGTSYEKVMTVWDTTVPNSCAWLTDVRAIKLARSGPIPDHDEIHLIVYLEDSTSNTSAVGQSTSMQSSNSATAWTWEKMTEVAGVGRKTLIVKNSKLVLKGIGPPANVLLEADTVLLPEHLSEEMYLRLVLERLKILKEIVAKRMASTNIYSAIRPLSVSNNTDKTAQ
jgi:hypothetical protein